MIVARMKDGGFPGGWIVENHKRLTRVRGRENWTVFSRNEPTQRRQPAHD